MSRSEDGGAERSGGVGIGGVIAVVLTLVLVWLLLPGPITSSPLPAYTLADQRNLGRQYEWLMTYKRMHGGALPAEGGHRFVLAAWMAGVVEPTVENFDRYWTPGPARERDPVYEELRAKVVAGEPIWTTSSVVGSGDTHYAGRALAHLATAEVRAGEAWMANDNEGSWRLRDGSVNVLFADSNVRAYDYSRLQAEFGVGPLDPEAPVVTFGASSPIGPCRRLAK